MKFSLFQRNKNPLKRFFTVKKTEIKDVLFLYKLILFVDAEAEKKKRLNWTWTRFDAFHKQTAEKQTDRNWELQTSVTFSSNMAPPPLFFKLITSWFAKIKPDLIQNKNFFWSSAPRRESARLPAPTEIPTNTNPKKSSAYHSAWNFVQHRNKKSKTPKGHERTQQQLQDNLFDLISYRSPEMTKNFSCFWPVEVWPAGGSSQTRVHFLNSPRLHADLLMFPLSVFNHRTFPVKTSVALWITSWKLLELFP